MYVLVVLYGRSVYNKKKVHLVYMVYQEVHFAFFCAS